MSRRRFEEGSIMVLVLLLSVVMLGLGLSVMWLSSSTQRVNTNITRRQEALSAAEAGLNRARIIASTLPSWDGLLGSSSGGGCGATRDDSTGKGNVLCTPTTKQPLENVPLLDSSSKSAAALKTQTRVTYTIYVRNDPVEAANGSIGPYKDNDLRVIVRSEGTASDGLSFAALEAVLIVGAAGGAAGTPGYGQKGGGAPNPNSAKTSIK